MGKKLYLFLACMLMSASMAFAQVSQVAGTVIDSDTGEPLVGASVRVVGTNLGVLTDIDGKFALKDLPKSAESIEVSYIGMNTVRAIIKKNMAITLTANAQDLDEVLVQAFGKAKKSAFTGSAKVVGSEELAKSQVSSVTEALAGAVPGLQMVSSNGAPGSTSTMRVRGFTSLNAGKDPLIIVDGAPYDGLDLNNLNPNDVESVTVLKDAASNALYGARGANGVIMITTKSATKGHDAKVTFDAKWGSNTRALQHYDVIKSPAQYYEAQYTALRNKYLDDGMGVRDAWLAANSTLLGSVDDGGLGYNIWNVPAGQYLIGTNGRLNPNARLGNVVSYKGEDYLFTPDDWEEVGTRTGLRQEYNASVAAAGEKSNFYSSLGYLQNEGITQNSDMTRLTGRLRADYQAKKWLKVGASGAYAHFKFNQLNNNGSETSTGNIWAFTSQVAPIYPIYHRNADGSIKYDKNGIAIMDYGDGKNGGGDRPFIQDANPIQDVRLNTRRSEGNSLNANVFADITFMPGLVLTVNGTTNLDETRSNIVYNPYYGQFDTTGGTVSVSHSRLYNFNTQQLLNYTTTIKDYHNLNVMVGHEYLKKVNTYLGATKSQMFSQDNKELDGAAVDGKASTSYRSFYNNEGYFGRAQYDYREKIFASASYRRDASSLFHPDNRWGSFWSVGAAWRMAKENWFKASWVDELKIKASYGSQGNDGIGSYMYTNRYNIVNAGGLVGTYFDGKGEKNITWETVGNFNTGVEFAFFKNRLVGSIEYYYRKTSDMLMHFNVAPSNGYTGYYKNIGDMYNTGVELDLTATLIRTKKVQWDFRLNGATVKNRVSYLHDDNKTFTFYDRDGKPYHGFTNDSFFIAEGSSIYTWRLKDYAGVDKETGESLWNQTIYLKDDAGEYVKDSNGDRIVTGHKTTKSFADADYIVTKESTVPKFFGGFGTTLNVHGFDLSINCTYSLGGKTLDYTYATFMASPTSNHGGYNYHKDILKAWSPTNTNSDIPRFQFADQYSAATSTRFLTSSSYLNIQNINFGYTFPKVWNMINSLRIYAAAENVAYFSARKGFDPRQSYSDGANATRYSPIRTISGGVTINF